MWRDFHPSKVSIVLGNNEPTAIAQQQALQATNIMRSTITSVPLADSELIRANPYFRQSAFASHGSIHSAHGTLPTPLHPLFLLLDQ